MSDEQQESSQTPMDDYLTPNIQSAQSVVQEPVHYQQYQSFSISQNIGGPVYQTINGTGGKYPDELCSATMGGTCYFLDGICKQCKRTIAEASIFYTVPSNHIKTSCPNSSDKSHDFQNDVCTNCGTSQ
jgi:hypothetical protein